MMGYTGVRKVNATVYADLTKTDTRVVTVGFKAYAKTIDEVREILTRQMERYADNPFVVEVKPISEHFEN